MKMAKEKYPIENKIIIIEDWDYKKNCQLNLDSIKLGYYSNKKAWWKCSKGNGCPQCAIEKRARHIKEHKF